MLRSRVRTTGMRNSNVIAIAPTADISNICGVSLVDRAGVPQTLCQVEHVGRLTVVNPSLVRDLKARGGHAPRRRSSS